MATAAVEIPAPAEPTPAPSAPVLPDYVTDNNAVLGDKAEWRYGRPPDYSNTRAVYERSKKSNHVAGTLPQLVETLVKNWEIEASFKSKLSDWRTVDHANYTFSINGGPPQSAEHMLKVGTYNAIIAPNEFYSPKTSDFAKSHKTFKRMMPTFAWEVMEVYSGPPKVSFRWRHWGEMKNDYVGFNDKGEKITAKAHGGGIDIQGVTVAAVNDALQLQSVDTWFDPLEMFRQIAPNGIVNKEIVDTMARPPAVLQIPTNGDHHDSPTESNKRPRVVSSGSDASVPLNGAVESFQESQNAGTFASATGELSHASSNHDEASDFGTVDTTVLEQQYLHPVLPNNHVTVEPGLEQLIHHEPENEDHPLTARQEQDAAMALSSTPTDTELATAAGESELEPNKRVDSTSLARNVTSEPPPAYQQTEETSGPDPAPLKTHYPNSGAQIPVEAPPLVSAVNGSGPVDSIARTVMDEGGASNGNVLADDNSASNVSMLSSTENQTETEPTTSQPGDAVAASATCTETRMAHEEMGRVMAKECPFLMNRE